MITQDEVPRLIAGKLPQVKNDLVYAGNIYQSIQVLCDYTKRMAIEHNFKMVEKCMSLVENIYEKGNTLVKNAVENVFVFSISSLMVLCNIIEWKIVQSYMPASLYSLYIKQVLQSKD
jgi:hypothetical protein